MEKLERSEGRMVSFLSLLNGGPNNTWALTAILAYTRDLLSPSATGGSRRARCRSVSPIRPLKSTRVSSANGAPPARTTPLEDWSLVRDRQCLSCITCQQGDVDSDKGGKGVEFGWYVTESSSWRESSTRYSHLFKRGIFDSRQS